jgi:two-component system, sensor histidine kinase PdtaS
MSEHSHLTECGLPGIKHIPYGVHMCNFYKTRDELIAALVPFFAAGLARNERCIWITAAPLHAAEAIVELEKSGADARAAIANGSLVVRDYDDWYAEAGALKGNQVVDLWLTEEQRALAGGYSGLRITGNVTFLRSEDWELFMQYEELVNKAFDGRRIVTLCTYHLESCGAAEVFDVVRRHNVALDRPDALGGFSLLRGGL